MMVDEATAASASAPKKRRKVRARTRAPAARAKPTAPALIAVYAVLGLLVIFTSGAVGYMIGKGAGGSGTTGTGEAQLTIVEYSDFECPFCSRAAPTVKQLKERYGDQVEIVYKHFPLESIHPNALNAAIAAECVRKLEGEDAFWTYHDTLFANQNALDAASLKRYAQQQGVSGFDQCFDSRETESTVRAHMSEAQQLGVRGTPSFMVGDEMIVGAQPYDVFAAAIDRKLAGAPTPQPAAPQEPQPPARGDVAEGRFSLGDADAPVVLVEFTDYQCPFCKRFHDQTWDALVSQYVETGKLRITMRHYPLPFHPDAQKASEAAECAGKVGGNDAFWAYHDALFDNQNALDVASLKRYAADLGLNTAQFNQCLDSGEMAQVVQNDMSEGSQAGVSGTPSFFLNGKQIVGAQPTNVFTSAIEAELQ